MLSPVSQLSGSDNGSEQLPLVPWSVASLRATFPRPSRGVSCPSTKGTGSEECAPITPASPSWEATDPQALGSSGLPVSLSSSAQSGFTALSQAPLLSGGAARATVALNPTVNRAASRRTLMRLNISSSLSFHHQGRSDCCL